MLSNGFSAFDNHDAFSVDVFSVDALSVDALSVDVFGQDRVVGQIDIGAAERQ